MLKVGDIVTVNKRLNESSWHGKVFKIYRISKDSRRPYNLMDINTGEEYPSNQFREEWLDIKEMEKKSIKLGDLV